MSRPTATGGQLERIVPTRASDRLRTALREAVEALVDLAEELALDTRAPSLAHSSESIQLDVKAAAKLLGISVSTLRRLEVNGILPGIRMGRRVFFRLETLARFAADNEQLRG